MQRQSVRDLPPNKNPTGTRCIQITIPDDDEWERDLYGEVWRLTRWMLWERDLGKNGKPVADRWLAAIRTWKHCSDTPPDSGGGSDEGEPLIRQNPDNPCEIQSSVDGTHWCTFIDLSLCQPSGPQQGDGTPTPAPGGQCIKYNATVTGPHFWLLPANVSSGDTMEFSNFAGASTGAPPVGRWNCPDGDLFTLGSCTDFKATDAGSFMPAEPIGVPIFYLDGAYHRATGMFTIPPGIDSQQVAFILNYPTSPSPSGTVTFDVQLCNNQSGDITLTYFKGSGPTSVPYGSLVTLTAEDITTDVRLEVQFSPPVKLTVTSAAGYVNTGVPGPGNQWGFIQLGSDTIQILVDPPDTDPTATTAESLCTGLVFSTAGPSAVFNVVLRLDRP